MSAASLTCARVAPTLAILVTRRCNMTCAHCSVESAPRVDTADPPEAELFRLVEEAARAGVKAVQFTGGEPMMRQKLVLELMRHAQRHGLDSGLTTNGFWGKNERTARATLKKMVASGLVYMTVSYDVYHAEFMGPEPILTLARIAREIGFHFNVNVTRTRHDENLQDYAHLFGSLPNVRMRLYDVQPVGRARNFDMPSLRAETEGFCNAAAQATITEDGRMIACNGPAYFDAPDSPRHVGRLVDSTLADLLHRHWDAPILDTIRTFGPAGLRDELLQQEEFAQAFDRRFAGQCDLCHYITGNRAMVQALQEPLASSRHQAMRVAKWSLIRNARQSGTLNRGHVNGPGAARVFYHKIINGAWPDDAEALFGRADVDWDQQATYLGGCGMAGQLAGSASQATLSRWAPPYFAASLQKRATRDALRELSHRDTLRQLHQHLAQLNLRGILLKGAALYLREQEMGVAPMRVPGDIDIWIEKPHDADVFRRHLLSSGFQGKADAPRTGPHHLAPVRCGNSSIEIHTDVMPSFWGLPEKAMADAALPIAGWSHFATLSPADMILHEAVHSTTHLYSYGMKLAYDLFRISRWAAHSSIAVDAGAIALCANVTHCPLAFWAPVIALGKGLPGSIPIVNDLLAHAPTGDKSRRVSIIAFRRLFTATDDADEMNPFTRNGIFLLMHDGLFARLRYVGELTRGDAAESRRTAMNSSGRQSWKNLRSHLRNAWIDLKAYRRAIR